MTTPARGDGALDENTTGTDDAAVAVSGAATSPSPERPEDDAVFPVDHGAGTEEDTDWEGEGGYVSSTDHGDGAASPIGSPGS